MYKFNYSSTTFEELQRFFDIKKSVDDKAFKEWFEFNYELKEFESEFLLHLIQKYKNYIEDFSEEKLKIKFIAPILNQVDFMIDEKSIQDWYDEPLYFKSEEFEFNGKVDFMVAKGVQTPQTPFFFIQEFKKSQNDKNPQYQLLAELIASLELNQTNLIKGAYVIGKIWDFVILEKVENNKYNFFISESLNSMKIEELKQIYINLQAVKSEIIEGVN